MVTESQVMLIQRHPRDLRSTLKVAHFSQIVAKYRIYSMAPTTNGYDSPIYIVAYFLARALPIWFLRGKYKQFQCSEKTCAGSLRSHRQRAFPPNCCLLVLSLTKFHDSLFCFLYVSILYNVLYSVSLFCTLYSAFCPSQPTCCLYSPRKSTSSLNCTCSLLFSFTVSSLCLCLPTRRIKPQKYTRPSNLCEQDQTATTFLKFLFFRHLWVFETTSG